MKKTFLLLLLFLLAVTTTSRETGSIILSLRVFPAESGLYKESIKLIPVTRDGSWSHYNINTGYHTFTIKCPGYESKSFSLEAYDHVTIEDKLERQQTGFKKLTEIGTGKRPKSVVFSPDGSCFAVTHLEGMGIGIYETENLTLLKEIKLPGTGFVECAFLPKHNELWVSQMTTGNIHIIDTDTFTYKRSIPSGGNWSKVITVSPSEEKVFVSNWLSHDVTELDADTGEVKRVFPLSGVPRGMAITQDEKALYVCIYDKGTIEKIDLDSGKSKVLPFGPGAKRHIVLDHKRNIGYASDMYHGRVIKFSLLSDKFMGSIWVGANVNTIDLSSDGSYLLVSSRGKNNPESYLKKGPEFGKVTAVDTEHFRIADWTWGRNQPTGLDIAPGDRIVAFTDFLDNNIEIYEIRDLWNKDKDLQAKDFTASLKQSPR
jgi:DNA-binding beta-propeller fold protein YncE